MTVDFQQQRVKMVDGQLRTTDVTDVSLLSAMLSVPREDFVPDHRQSIAYIDEDIEIAGAVDGRDARYLMEPSPFAKLAQLAKIRADERVLDVACGAAYSSVVLSRLAGEVVALESHPELCAKARGLISTHSAGNVTLVEGALTAGHPAKAPYDVILVNGAVDELPATLFDQLAEGGRLVGVVGRGNAGRAMVYVKEDGLVSGRVVFNAAVRPLDEFQRTPEFQF